MKTFDFGDFPLGENANVNALMLILPLSFSPTTNQQKLGTYFNCIMFMVASSVVTTIMILNYHHRLADTHEMPNWVSWISSFVESCPGVVLFAVNNAQNSHCHIYS